MHDPNESTDPVVAFRRKQLRHRIRILLAALLAVALFGLLPIPLGLGYFGWKLFRFDRVSLTLVNTSSDDLEVTIGNGSTVCPRGRVCSLDFRAGDVVLEAATTDGTVIEEIAFFTDNYDLFYNFNGARCYAVVDVSGFYTGDTPFTPYRIVDRIYTDDRIYEIPADHFIRPGGVLPDSARGDQAVIWIDRASCLLLEPEDEHLLVGQLHARMQNRRERQRELREEQ